MDQDVLTNGALGALWKQDQARRLAKTCPQTSQLLQHQSPNRFATPGFLTNSLGPKSNNSLSFPQLQLGQKRKGNWNEPNKTSCSATPAKRTKFSLKEMAEEFTASQIELAARSVMLPRAPDNKNSLKKLPGISESINIFMNPESVLKTPARDAAKDPPKPNMDDLSWADPTPIRETTEPTRIAESTNSLLEPTPVRDSALNLEPTPIREPTSSLHESQVRQDTAVQRQDLSCTGTSSMEESSLLHQTIRLFPTNYELVKSALELNAKDLRRKDPLQSGPSSKNCPDTFGYPLNIAILNDASLEVLQLLVKAAPDVITLRDGSNCYGSLSLVLERRAYSEPKKFLEVLHLLIKANPKSLRMTDHSQNTPLHVALASGCGLELIRVLCLLHPPALLHTNAKGETPLQIAQRHHCQESVLKFLEEAYSHELRRVSSLKC